MRKNTIIYMISLVVGIVLLGQSQLGDIFPKLREKNIYYVNHFVHI